MARNYYNTLKRQVKERMNRRLGKAESKLREQQENAIRKPKKDNKKAATQATEATKEAIEVTEDQSYQAMDKPSHWQDMVKDMQFNDNS